jgi:hypothetical protein
MGLTSVGGSGISYSLSVETNRSHCTYQDGFHIDVLIGEALN